MGAFELLKSEREKRGLSRVHVSRATKIYAHHIAALEHANFEELSDRETVESYVRTYADYLELDANALAADCRKELAALGPTLAQPGQDEPTPVAKPPIQSNPAAADPTPRGAAPGWLAPLVTGALVLVVLAFAGWWLWPRPETTTGSPDVELGPIEPSGLDRHLPEVIAELEPSEPAVAATTTDRPPAAVAPTAPVTQRREPPPPAESAATRAALRPELTIRAHGVGTGVEDRKLVGESDRFVTGTRVSFWTHVQGGAPGRSIDHVWIHDGREVDRITLKLGSASWRTQSRKTIWDSQAGEWAVEARDEDGRLLASSAFTARAR